MDTLYVINGQTVYSFCFSTRCKTTRTTSLGVNKRTSTREVPNPLVIIIGVPFAILFPTSQKTVSINGVLLPENIFKQAHLPTMSMPR